MRLLIIEDDESTGNARVDAGQGGQLHGWLAALNPRQRIVIERRFGLEGQPLQSLAEIARELGVSRERVRQIEVRAFEKLQKAMQAAAVDRNLVDA